MPAGGESSKLENTARRVSSEVKRLFETPAMLFSGGRLAINGRVGSFFHSFENGPEIDDLKAIWVKSVSGSYSNASTQLWSRKKSRVCCLGPAETITGARCAVPNIAAPGFFQRVILLASVSSSTAINHATLSAPH